MAHFLARNKLLILLALVVLGAGLWYAFLGASDTGSLLVNEDLTTSTNASDKELVQTLLQLRAIELNGTIFTAPSFMALQDFGSQIVPEPVGRPNPFAPLGASAAASSTAAGGQ